jgi:hypothetical protein
MSGVILAKKFVLNWSVKLTLPVPRGAGDGEGVTDYPSSYYASAAPSHNSCYGNFSKRVTGVVSRLSSFLLSRL